MKATTIASTGCFLPEKILHNEDFDGCSETARSLISQKTGVFARRNASEKDCTSDLAARAAEHCLSKIGFAADALEGIIVSTSSPDRMQPATATRVQHLLGARRAFAFDINSVCSGSVYGIALADALIRSGQCGNVLLIAAEMYSKILNKKDFSTFPYFGDGAGAIFFCAGKAQQGVLASILRTDGSGAEIICVPAGGTMLPYDRLSDPKSAYFKMKGKEVFLFAVEKGTEVIRDLLDETGTEPEKVRCFICHQANVNIILKIAENLSIPPDKFYVNLFRYGNTASASVPIALDESISRGVLGPGDLAVTAAFGGGLSWGANLIRI